MPLKDRVAERLTALKMKPATASRRMGEGIAKTFVRDILDERKLSVRGDNLVKLAAALETTPNYLLEKEDGGRMQDSTGLDYVRSVEVPVRGEVAAGQWSEALARLSEPFDTQITERVLIVAPNGYAPNELYALKVRGPSFNREYPDGHIVIVTPGREADVVEGDHVIVLCRDGPRLAEATIKEVVRAASGRWALESRSTEEEYAATWPIDDHVRKPEIVGIVVGSMTLRQRPQRMLKQ